MDSSQGCHDNTVLLMWKGGRKPCRKLTLCAAHRQVGEGQGTCCIVAANYLQLKNIFVRKWHILEWLILRGSESMTQYIWPFVFEIFLFMDSISYLGQKFILNMCGLFLVILP